MSPSRGRARLRTPRGVFRPHSDARLLAATITRLGLARGARVLDLFTGSGVLAVAAGLGGAETVTAVDVSRRALAAARRNARANGTRVRALRGDLFAPVAGERFDLILANPPYLPGRPTPPRGIARAWEGGSDGRLLVDRLCDGAYAHLADGGTLVLVQSSLTGERATLDRLAAAGLPARVLVRARGPLGPLARACVADAEDEELLVIAAERPPLPAPALGPHAAQAPAAPARITPYRDGPYLLRGPFELTDQDGAPIPCARQTIALCRCGRSQIRPFCDGTHKLVGFHAAGGAEDGADGADRGERDGIRRDGPRTGGEQRDGAQARAVVPLRPLPDPPGAAS